MSYEYRIIVYLSGDTPLHLCTVDTAEGVGAIVASLCAASRPHWTRIEVQIAPRQAQGG